MFESVKILREDVPVQNVTVTTVTFWNAGRDPINREDIAPNDPLRIELKNNVEILEIPKLQGKLNPANNIKLEMPKKGQIRLDFDYLSKDEALIAQIVHDGVSEHDIEFLGTIKGHQLKLKSPKSVSDIKILPLIFIGIAITCGLFLGYKSLNDMASSDSQRFKYEARRTILENHKIALDKLKEQKIQSGDIANQIKEIGKRTEAQLDLIDPDRNKPIYQYSEFWLIIGGLLSFLLGALLLSKFT